MPPSSPLPRAYAGIDVAKRKFDVVLLLEDQHIHRLAGQYRRRICGAPCLGAENKGLLMAVCLESTGSSSDTIVHFLLGHRYSVSLLNPAVLMRYRKTKNMRHQTDKVGAYFLALYGKDERPAAWLPISEEIMRLRSFLASRDDLMHTTVQERNPSQKFQKFMSAPIFDGQE